MKSHSTGGDHRVHRRETGRIEKCCKINLMRLSISMIFFIVSFYMKAASIPILVLTSQAPLLPGRGSGNFLQSCLSISIG